MIKTMNNIKDTKFNTGIEDIKKITMTDTEKNQILQSVLISSVAPKQPIKSPWATYSFSSMIRTHRVASYIVACSLILILGGQGIVSASGDSLPGDILYPIKVKVVERVNSALKSSPEAKAKYESSLATTRLEEAETLAVQNRLDDKKEKELNDLLSDHTKALDQALAKIDQTKSGDEVDDIVTNFQAGMNAHAQVLDIIHEPQNPSDDSKDDIEKIKISRNARKNGENVRNTFKKEEERMPTKYTKRKKQIESLIDSTSTDLDRAAVIASPAKQAIIEDTHKKLDQAKEFLKKADEEDQKEDSKDSYSTLLDSESSIKEADIFLKTGLNLKSEDSKQKRFRNKGDNKWQNSRSRD